LPSPYMLYS